MGPDDPSRIVELENMLGMPLPGDYREFLLHMAPCAFKYHLDFSPIAPSNLGQVSQDAFFGLEEGSGFDIVRVRERAVRNQATPLSMLGIAYDSGGRKFLIALDEPPDRIYHQEDFTDRIHLCGHTFTDFVQRGIRNPEYAEELL